MTQKSWYRCGVVVIEYIAPTIGGGSLLKGKRYKRRRQKNIHNKAIQTKIHLYINKSLSSSCRAASMDIPDPLSPLLPIVHTSGRSSGLHPVSSQSCCMYVRAGRPAFARPYVGVHRSISLMSFPCFSSSVLHVWFV